MTTPTTVNVQFQLRADTAANWTAENPTLLANEFALETDTKKLKVGDGSTAWASLAYFPSIVSGGTVLGNLEIGSTGTLTFEGSTANDYETTLAVTDPTADRTITLPDQSGTVVVSGNASIVDADIAANAEIAVSKLANGTANQVLVTDGTDVSWSDDLTIAGNLTVNGTTTTVNTQTLVVEDKNIELGVVGTPTDLTADGGGITLKGTTDKTINWVDSTDAWTSSEHIDLASGKSYRINNTEVLSATTLGSGVTSSSLTSVGTLGSLTVTGDLTVDTNTLYVDSTNNRVGLGTSSPSQLLTIRSSTDSHFRLENNVGDGYNIYRKAADGILQFDGTQSTGFNGYNFSTTPSGGSLTSRFFISTAGNVGVGTTTPGGKLVVSDGSTTFQFDPVGGTGNILRSLTSGGSRDSLLFDASQYVYSNGATEYARIDSSGRLLLGTTSSIGVTLNNLLQVSGSGAAGGGAVALGFNGTVDAASYLLGGVQFNSVSTSWATGAQITAVSDGAHSSTSRPTRLVFSTCPDSAAAPVERMRITNGGNVTIGSDGNTTLFNQTSVTGAVIERAGAIQLARSGDQSLLINRISSDGTLVSFYQDGTQEGTISVSGSTVSYNGAHLSRWSQLPSGQERTEILRGTVLSNIDEMCEWGEEDNEQLNRMKVSDIEGDKNVSGVFQAWDDDDDTYTNDFYCAMTGDFIIRIAAGITVERGDLLMSAGDGTAKPQDDDIIRSKTIAKVTSTNVSCTYDDGSYCVPCVLMAC